MSLWSIVRLRQVWLPTTNIQLKDHAGNWAFINQPSQTDFLFVFLQYLNGLPVTAQQTGRPAYYPGSIIIFH